MKLNQLSEPTSAESDQVEKVLFKKSQNININDGSYDFNIME